MKFNFAQSADENMASYRYRVKGPAEYLKTFGWKQTKNWWDSDITIIGKHWYPALDYALVQELERRGICTVFDVCDWHMEGKTGKHYKRMIAKADGVIVPSESWASVGIGRAVHIAGDGYEFEEKPPKCEASSPLKILWYGHARNISSLQKVAPPADCVIEILTSPNSGVPGAKDYSKEKMIEGLEWCDLVIVPAESPLKSPNRVLEAVRSGRFVVASDLPQHRPCATCCGDINEGIEWYRNNLPEAFLRLQDAQEAVKKLYSPETIGEQWKVALEAIYQQKLRAAA